MSNSNNRKVQIYNYIPHRRPRHIDFQKWYEEYKPRIIDLYDICKQVMENRYPDVEFKPEAFTNFVRMVYSASSKYIQNSV
jgi:hypothetical protein